MFLFDFFLLPSSPAGVRGQGQSRSRSQKLGALLKDLFFPAVRMFGNSPAAATAGQPGGRTFAGKPLLHHRLLSTGSPAVHDDAFITMTRHLICNHIWFPVFPKLPPAPDPKTRLPSPQCCATCVTAEFCTTKLNQKREMDI